MLKIIWFRDFILRGLFWLLLPIALVLGGCAEATQHRFKVTVNVEADGKIYSGSSIMEEKYYVCPDGWDSTCANHMTSRGEAIVVNVEGHGYLFLLQDYDYVERYARSQVKEDVSNFYEEYKVKEATFDTIGKWEIEELNRLSFATFTDINDPRSVKKIIPITYQEYRGLIDANGNVVYENNKIKEVSIEHKANFEEYFGKGSKIKSVIVTPTNEPLTWGQVEKVIPWIKDDIASYNKTQRSLYFSGDRSRIGENIFYTSIGFTHFIRR